MLRKRPRSSRKSLCRGQIAHYKIPRYVKFVDAFPMTLSTCFKGSAIR
jgi:hypothetical protein